MTLAHRTFILLLLSGLTTSAFAAVDYVPLQERAQGQSLTGGNVLNDSLFSNPAGSTFTQVYAVEANMQSARNFAVSVLDTKSGGLGGGLAYFRRAESPTAPLTQGGRVNLASRISDNLGIGASGKLVSGVEYSGAQNKLTDVDAGLLANFNVIQAGLNIRNLFGGNKEMGLPRELVLGTRFNYGNQLFFSASSSFQKGLRPDQVGFGAEYVSPYYFSIKGGYLFLPRTPQASWSAGLSFVSPKLSAHYAVEFPNLGREMLHQIGLTLLL